MDELERFHRERRERIAAYRDDEALRRAVDAFVLRSMESRYVYNFDWLGRPVIQYPQDLIALQEIIWRTRPDVIVETGIAHGGSLVFSASMLALLDLCDGIGENTPKTVGRRRVIGVDIDIRAHNRRLIEAHPMACMIDMIEGSSIDEATVAQVRERIAPGRRVMVCLDSNHTHDHVLRELQLYAPLVTPGNYCVVFDTFVEDLPESLFPDRPWGKGNNPRTAVRVFLESEPAFAEDAEMTQKFQITAAPGGYLVRRGDDGDDG